MKDNVIHLGARAATGEPDENAAWSVFVQRAERGDLAWNEVLERLLWNLSCPRCGAAPGAQCRSSRGLLLRRDDSHVARWQAARNLLSGFEPRGDAA